MAAEDWYTMIDGWYAVGCCPHGPYVQLGGTSGPTFPLRAADETEATTVMESIRAAMATDVDAVVVLAVATENEEIAVMLEGMELAEAAASVRARLA